MNVSLKTLYKTTRENRTTNHFNNNSDAEILQKNQRKMIND